MMPPRIIPPHLRCKPVSVLFVCLGNICRSPAADGIMHSLVEEHAVADRWTIDSAGIGGWHVGDLPDKRMRVHARRRGYELTHRARQVREADFERFDLIIGMDAQNIDDLRHIAPTPEAMAKIYPISRWMGRVASPYDYVPDPYYDGAEGFENVLTLLEDALSALLSDWSTL